MQKGSWPLFVTPAASEGQKHIGLARQRGFSTCPNKREHPNEAEDAIVTATNPRLMPNSKIS